MIRRGLVDLSAHPLVSVWLTGLRDAGTESHEFRSLLGRITYPLVLEGLWGLETEPVLVTTPLEETVGNAFYAEIAVAAILRAALGMVGPIQELLPSAKVFHVDMYRNEETLQPVWGRSKIPSNCAPFFWLVPDPMLATGGSAIATISLLKERGAKKIIFLCVLAAPEGIMALSQAHPDVSIVTACVDRALSDGKGSYPKGYILPGLGDAGDRQFGT